MVDYNATLSQLLKTRHAEIPLFIVRMENTESFAGFGSEEGKELFRAHLMYWWELEDRGHLFAAGPVDVGLPGQEGLAILAAATFDEAVELAHAEPLHVAGWRRNSVRRWQLNEGLGVDTARASAARFGGK